MHFLSGPSPQQDNSFDCGLFLLHYIELFLDEAPFNFYPFKLTKFSNFEMQFTLLSAPFPMDPQSFNPSDMVLKEHFEPRAIAGTSLGHCQSLDQQSSDRYLNGSIFSMKVSTCVFVCTCMSCEFFFFFF
ncbi:hypothetical protein AAZV13_16G099900 [Glycine max]